MIMEMSVGRKPKRGGWIQMVRYRSYQGLRHGSPTPDSWEKYEEEVKEDVCENCFL